MRFTTSWDDGHPLDLRVAELLTRYGFSGTFYVPRSNVEGRAVLSASQLRTLGDAFEVGAHTLDHVRLDRVPAAEARRQVIEGKQSLEDELGRAVTGFCYPGGVHNPGIRALVKSAGFRYARTIENFSVERPRDAFRLPTTIQLYPHRRITYVKNYVSGGRWLTRSAQFALSFAMASSFERILRMLIERAHHGDGVFHIWGHSWELEEQGLWGVLEQLLRIASELVPAPQRVNNAAL